MLMKSNIIKFFSSGKRSIFFTYYMVIALTLLLCIVFALFFIITGTSLISQNQVTGVEFSAKQLENEFKETSLLLDELASDSNIQLIGREQSPEYEEYYSVMKLLLYRVGGDNFTSSEYENTYILFDNMNVVVSSMGSYSFDYFDNQNIISESSFVDYATESDDDLFILRDVNHYGTMTNLLIMKRNFSFNSSSCIIRVFTEQELLSYFSLHNSSIPTYIELSLGNEIIASNKTIEGSIISHELVDENQLFSYYVAQPTSVLLAPLIGLLVTILLILFTTFFVLIILSLRSLKRHNKQYNTLEDLNSEYEEEISNSRPFITAMFYKNLLDGKLERLKEPDRYAKYTDITNYSSYCVLSVSVESDMDQNCPISLFELSELLKTFKFIIHIHNITDNKIAIIIDGVDYKDNVNAIVDRIGDIEGVYIGVGTVETDISGISCSFYNSSAAIMSPCIGKDEKVVYYSDLDKCESCLPSLSDNTRLMLYNSITSGDIDNTRQITDNLVSTYLVDISSSKNTIRLIVFDMYKIIVKAEEAVKIKSPELTASLKQYYNNFNDNDDVTNFDISIHMLNGMAHDVSVVKEHSYGDDIAPKLFEYVKEHYNDQCIGLQALAEEFGISESYVSRIFKKAYDRNFVNFLEQLRIEKSCDFLTESNMPIAKISETVGYLYVNTFNKAFKRHVGMSPSEYRRQKAIPLGK